MEQIGLEIQGAQFDLLERKFEPEGLGVEQRRRAGRVGGIGARWAS
jgi:hypothetical protein